MFFVDQNYTKANSSYFTREVSSNNDDFLPSRNCIGNTCQNPYSTEVTSERNCIMKTNGKIFRIQSFNQLRLVIIAMIGLRLILTFQSHVMNFNYRLILPCMTVVPSKILLFNLHWGDMYCRKNYTMEDQFINIQRAKDICIGRILQLICGW